MNPYAILPLTLAILFFALGLFCFLQKNRPYYATMFSLLCLATTGWQLSWAILFNISNHSIASILVRIGYMWIIFIPVFYYHFVCEFFNIRKTSPFDNLFLGLSYVVAFLFEFFLWATDYYINGYYTYFWGYYPMANFLHVAYLLLLSIQAFRSIHLLYFFGFQKDFPLTQKKQSRLMFYAFLIYFFAAIDFLVNYGVEFYPPGIIFISIALTITSYAITKNHLMNIRVMISRIQSYGIVAILLFLSFAVLNYFLMQPGLAFLTNILVGIFWAIAAHPLRLHLQTTPDRFLFRKKYEYEQAIKEFGEICQSIIDPAKLIGLFKDQVQTRLKMKSGRIYLADKNGNFTEKHNCAAR